MLLFIIAIIYLKSDNFKSAIKCLEDANFYKFDIGNITNYISQNTHISKRLQICLTFNRLDTR